MQGNSGQECDPIISQLALESRTRYAMKSVNVKRNNVYYMSRPALPTKQQTLALNITPNYTPLHVMP